MAVIASYTQQPADNLDYDIDYGEWLSNADSLLSATVAVAPAGLTVQSPLVVGERVKLWVSGGTSGTKYKVTVTTTTTLGRIKQDEIKFSVKDI